MQNNAAFPYLGDCKEQTIMKKSKQIIPFMYISASQSSLPLRK